MDLLLGLPTADPPKTSSATVSASRGRNNHGQFDHRRSVGHIPCLTDDEFQRRHSPFPEPGSTNAAIGVRPMYCHRNSAGSGNLSVMVDTVADTSRSPAARSRPATSSGSCMENTALTNPPRSGLMCSTMRPLEKLEDRWYRPRSVDHDPARRRGHPASRRPRRLVSMNIRPIWHSTTSTEPSGIGSAAASAICQSMGAPAGAGTAWRPRSCPARCRFR